MLRTRQVDLDANGDGQDTEGGGVLIVESNTDNSTIDITWIDSRGNDAGTIKAAKVGRKYAAGEDFYGYRIHGAANATVKVLIGPAGSDATNEPNNDTSNPIPVQSVLGSTFTDDVPVAIDQAGEAIYAADATRRAVNLKNAGANPVAILAAQATAFANAALVILPGETVNIVDAARCAIYGKCDAGLVSTINRQKVNT